MAQRFGVVDPIGDMISAELGLRQNREKQLANEETEMLQPYVVPTKEEELIQKALANQKNQAESQWWGQNAKNDAEIKAIEAQMRRPELQSEIDARIAQAKRSNQQFEQGPSIGSDPASQLREADRLRKMGMNERADIIEKAVHASIGSKTNVDERNWGRMPVKFREHELAVASQMGYDPETAQNAFTSGRTLQDLAREKGISPEKLATFNGYYPPGTALLTQTAKRSGTDAELEFLNEKTTEWRKPYKGIVSDLTGVSPSYIKDLMTGKNQKQREELIAAYILALDVPAGSLRLASIEGGITSLQQQMEHQLAKVKPVLSGADPEAWANGTKLAMDTLSQGNTIYYDVATNPGPYMQKRKEKYGIGNNEYGNTNQNVTQSIAQDMQGKPPLSELNDDEFMKQYNAQFGQGAR
jgi:hypothetical protein